MKVIELLNYSIAALFFICYLYQFIYVFVSLLKKPKPHKQTTLHNYAVLISARNEEMVIGQLIDSIKAQTYDKDRITVFVVADNCTDKTAAISKNAGAVVYERHDTELIGKGYALNFLLKKIDNDYPDKPFDAFFIFDADNILDENYIAEMNKTFSDGYQIVTSYRNSKNFGDNWISSGYALWFLREARYLNYPRMLVGSSCAVSGTGFMFAREIIEMCGGWNFFLLTEDIEFTAFNVSNGRKIGYCGEAMLYDEQPTSFAQSWRQRLRWSRGFLQVFRRYGLKLQKGIICNHSFPCYDITMAIMPAFVLSMVGISVDIVSAVVGIATGHPEFAQALLLMVYGLVNTYLLLFALGLIATITEWRKIHTTKSRKILYLFTFPLFMLTYIPIALVALFKKVSWQPISHNRAKTLEEIRDE